MPKKVRQNAVAQAEYNKWITEDRFHQIKEGLGIITHNSLAANPHLTRRKLAFYGDL